MVEERLGELIVDSGVVLILDGWRGDLEVERELKFKSGEQRGGDVYIRSFKSSIRKQADGGETTSRWRRERVEVRELIKHAGGPECDKSNPGPAQKKN